MTSPVISVDCEARIRDVAWLLLEKRIGAVLVVEIAIGLVGIVSGRDLMRYTMAAAGSHVRRSWWLALLA